MSSKFQTSTKHQLHTSINLLQNQIKVLKIFNLIMEADQNLNLDKEEQNFVQNYVRRPQIPLYNSNHK